MTNKKDAELGAATIRAFLDQFGSPSDPGVGVFLEILLEELHRAKIVSLLGGSQQTGGQVDSDTPRRLGGISGNRLETVEPPVCMGETDSANH